MILLSNIMCIAVVQLHIDLDHYRSIVYILGWL